MRQIDDYFDIIPESLMPSTLVANGTISRILTLKRIESSDYNKPDVKLRLLQIYAYCCAYCEARVSNYDPIDHFRAKNAITGVNNTEGYYWLGCCWSNLLMTCSVCNSSFKRNHFPITGHRATLPIFSPTNPNAFFERCHIRSTELQDELPLLLHPVLDNPNAYLVFEENGTVSALDNNSKGMQSIEIYGLSNWTKRELLIQERQKVIENIRKDVFHAILHYVSDDRLYEDLAYIHLKLIRKIQERLPFSAVRRACLVNFKSFFIDKFSSEEEIRLSNAYQRLKDNLITI
jgi:hypothetical protein